MKSPLAALTARILLTLSIVAVGNMSAKAALVGSYSFENGSLADQAISDGTQNLTLFADAIVTSPGINGNGKLSVDGSGDYAFSASPGTNGFTSGSGITLATWFRTTTIASNTQQLLIQLPIAGGGLNQSAAGLDISAGKIQVGGRSLFSEGFQGTGTTATNTLILSSNTTYFAAAVIDYANDFVTAYLYDGAVWKTDSAAVSFTNPTGSGNQGLYLGRRADNQRPFNGAIDDVKIFNTALSQSEVVAIAVPEANSAMLLIVALGATFVNGRIRL
jgi:hypothetical protein